MLFLDRGGLASNLLISFDHIILVHYYWVFLQLLDALLNIVNILTWIDSYAFYQNIRASEQPSPFFPLDI